MGFFHHRSPKARDRRHPHQVRKASPGPAPPAASVSYTYDELNRLSTVVDNRLQGSNTTTYTYDSASNLVTAAYPNGLTSAFTYDALNRLTELATSEPSGPPVADYKYTAWPRSHSPFPNQLRVPPVPRFWGPGREAHISLFMYSQLKYSRGAGMTRILCLQTDARSAMQLSSPVPECEGPGAPST